MNDEIGTTPGHGDRIGSPPKGGGTASDAGPGSGATVPGTDVEPMGTDGRRDTPGAVLGAVAHLGEPLAFEVAEHLGVVVAVVDHRLRELMRAGKVTRSSEHRDGRWRWRAAP